MVGRGGSQGNHPQHRRVFIVQPNSFGNETEPDPILLWVPNMRYLRFTDCVNTPRLAA
jgi:hypothetical protein